MFRWILLAALLLIAPANAAECVTASWYGPREHGRLMANGDRFNQWAHTAAHKTLPFGTEIHLRNPANGAVARVTVTDRGPFIKGRSLDVSRAVARILRMEESGLAMLEVTIMPKPSKRHKT